MKTSFYQFNGWLLFIGNLGKIFSVICSMVSNQILFELKTYCVLLLFLFFNGLSCSTVCFFLPQHNEFFYLSLGLGLQNK